MLDELQAEVGERGERDVTVAVVQVDSILKDGGIFQICLSATCLGMALSERQRRRRRILDLIKAGEVYAKEFPQHI